MVYLVKKAVGEVEFLKLKATACLFKILYLQDTI